MIAVINNEAHYLYYMLFVDVDQCRYHQSKLVSYKYYIHKQRAAYVQLIIIVNTVNRTDAPVSIGVLMRS